MAMHIINFDYINSCFEEIKSIIPEAKLYLKMINKEDNSNKQLEINLDNKCEIDDWFQEKFYNQEENYLYAISQVNVFQTETEEEAKEKVKSVIEIRRKYNL